MYDNTLKTALRRLDHWLLFICDEEEQRAKLLAGNGDAGWNGVRNLLRPEADSLTFTRHASAADILPDGNHVFHRIGRALQLETCECEALLVVLASYLEPRYQSLYAVLQDDLKQTRPTERLLLSVLGREQRRRKVLTNSLRRDGRLAGSGFISCEPGNHPPLGRTLYLPDDVLSVLLGATEPLIPGATTQRWWPGTGKAQDIPSCQVIHGSGDRVALAHELGEGAAVLEVRVPAVLSEARSVLQAAWRIGLATETLPLLDLGDLEGCDLLPAGRFMASLMHRYGGRAWLLSAEPLAISVPHVECQPPIWASRRQAWLDEARRRNVELQVDAAGRLASRHRLKPKEIGEVFASASGHDEQTLDGVARRMGGSAVAYSLRKTPQRGFEDLVLRDATLESLQRLVFYVQNRDILSEKRGLQHRFQLQYGPIALFAGCSGTGKTLAAEAVAKALQCSLYTVDIARLVSKYIGDTEKHIDDILTQGERTSAVIFFDEADVLFSSRLEKVSNASDHFANMLVGYLLQRIERHDGLVILATNLRHAIDEAFMRRYQFRIEFPRPEPDERRRIWELMLPPGVPRDRSVDLEQLARRHRLTGGEIRNAALKAIFLSENSQVAVSQEILERAVALELLELGRITRRPQPDNLESSAWTPDRGQLLRRCGDAFQDAIEAYLHPRFLKEIYVIHGSPTKETLGGRRPAVSITLFRLAARRNGNGVRLGFIISTWSHRAEEEYELLGIVHEAISRMSFSEIEGRMASLRMQESHDFDLLHRFWSSHEQPLRASIVADIEIG